MESGGKLIYTTTANSTTSVHTYDTKPEAALAYDAAARTEKGSKAVCNFDSLGAAHEAAANARWEFLHHTPNAQDQSRMWWRKFLLKR
jgi:hypothetical protein